MSVCFTKRTASKPVYSTIDKLGPWIDGQFLFSTSLQNLSLRNNRLDDNAIMYISYALGDTRRQNTKLLSLNLNGNLVHDAGAISLARVTGA